MPCECQSKSPDVPCLTLLKGEKSQQERFVRCSNKHNVCFSSYKVVAFKTNKARCFFVSKMFNVILAYSKNNTCSLSMGTICLTFLANIKAIKWVAKANTCKNETVSVRESLPISYLNGVYPTFYDFYKIINRFVATHSHCQMHKLTTIG